ncbi:MAG TPA: HU family DNA-binding protein, partial [Paludibacter sp.]|nr:HU family DNA-binding protein [Paludibacter sp.]
MAFHYEVKTKRSGLGNKEAKYYAIPVRSGEVSTRQLAREISKRCTLSETDVRATLIALTETMQDFLHDGYSVKLDDLGRFTISATSDGFDTPEECTPKKVRANKICFMADKELKRNLKGIEF